MDVIIVYILVTKIVKFVNQDNVFSVKTIHGKSILLILHANHFVGIHLLLVMNSVMMAMILDMMDVMIAILNVKILVLVVLRVNVKHVM